MNYLYDYYTEQSNKNVLESKNKNENQEKNSYEILILKQKTQILELKQVIKKLLLIIENKNDELNQNLER